MKILVALTLATEANAATYYVSTSGSDSNNGSAAAPWQTVSKAASTAAAGDTVNVATGTYGETVTFGKSGSAGNPITFVGSSGTIIAGNITLGGNYVTVSGITCSPPTAGGYNAISLNGQYDVLTNCTVVNYGATASDQATAITPEGAYDTVINCTIRDLNDIDAFHVFGHDQTIMGCTISNVNVVYYNLNHTDGFQTWGQGGLTSYNVLIKNCLMINSACDIGNTETDGSTGTHDWTFENDIFINVANPIFSGLPNTRFYNCIFYKSAGSPVGSPVIFYGITNYSSAGSEVVNCVFLGSGTSGIASDGVTLSTLRISQNYFGTASYGALSGAYLGTSVINGGNLNFRNESVYDFHLLTNSPLIGAGTNLYGAVATTAPYNGSGFTTDRDGNTRPAAGNWDIGVYAYSTNTGTAPNTPTIQVNPGSIGYGMVPVGTSETNSLMVKNVGTGTLSGTASVAAPFSVISGGNYSLATGQTQAVTVVFSPVVATNYTQSVIFTGGGGTNVTVSGSVTNSLALPPPRIVTATVTANITNQITLQFCTNLSSAVWWPLGSFAGSTTLSFTNMPAVLIRGVCNNLTGSITLTWPASTSPSTVGYKVYYGTSSGVYSTVINVGKATTVTIPNLVGGVVYFFLVDTYNSLGTVIPYLSETSATPAVPKYSLSIGH